MREIFLDSFVSVLLALAQIFSIVILAGFLVRKAVITQAQISALSQATVYVFLPALIFANILEKFQPANFPLWYLIPLIAISMVFVGIGVNSLFFIRKLKQKKNLLPLGSMQNAGYLVLPLGQLLYHNQFDEFSLYVFLFILGFNPVLWSVGKILTSSNHEIEKQISWKDYISPPLILTLLSIFLVLSNLHVYVPKTFVQASGLLGAAAVPVATFVLGATLGTVKIKAVFSFYEMWASLVTKFFILPLITLSFILITNLHLTNPLMADFFIIESSVAPATGIILMLRTYGGDSNKIGAMILISYIFSALATPMALALWKTFF